MRLRTFLVAGSALVAAATLSLAPFAQADPPSGPVGPIASVAVGGNAALTNYGVTLDLKSGMSLSMDVFGVPMDLTCSSGSASGIVQTGSPAPSPFMNIYGMTLTCDSLYPGTSASLTLTDCARVVMSDATVREGTVDTGAAGNVTGTLTVPTGLGPGCVMTLKMGALCTTTIGGSTTAQFDEAVTSTSPIKQDLILTGSGLSVLSSSFFCQGMFNTSDPVSINNFKFSVTANHGAGAIDFRPSPSNIASVGVGGSTATADHGAALTLKPGASVTAKVFGSPTELFCDSGSGTGTVHAGSPAPATFMNLDSMTPVCESILPDQVSSWNVPSNGCANITLSDSNVHDGTVDTAGTSGFDTVQGYFNLPVGCSLTGTAGPCTYTIGGSTGVEFDEAVTSTSPVKQDLVIKGNGLKVRSTSFLCFGALTVGDPVTFNNFKFSTTLNGGAGAIDVRRTA